MKPHFLKVPLRQDLSFSVRRDVVPYFYNRWHFHPEVELLYIEAGSGTQVIGDGVQNFGPGDLILVGANLPHYWRCEEKYFKPSSPLRAIASVVHFREDFWGERFLELPENRSLRELLHAARRGLRFEGAVRDEAALLLGEMLLATGRRRLLLLQEVLGLLAESPERQVLSSEVFGLSLSEDETERIHKIFAFSLAHFQRKISLEEVAGVAAISPHSFCRYFKSRTGKTYTQFLLEIRVGHACRLLLERELPIAQVCFESGFFNFSSFNKAFKAVTGKNPLKYQQWHR